MSAFIIYPLNAIHLFNARLECYEFRYMIAAPKWYKTLWLRYLFMVVLTICNCYGCKGSGRKIRRCKFIRKGVIIFPINGSLHPLDRHYIFPANFVVTLGGTFRQQVWRGRYKPPGSRLYQLLDSVQQIYVSPNRKLPVKHSNWSKTRVFWKHKDCKIAFLYLFHRTHIMDVFFTSWYKSHSNVLQLQISILKCRIMCPEVKFLNNTEHNLFLQPKFRLQFHNAIVLPSNLRGSNKNTHLQNQQMLDSSLVFLRNTVG